jgi:hypothetical protein
MSNMSYCRFQNTLGDLFDCQEALDNGELEDGQLSDEEERAAKRLIDVCREIAHDHGELEG